LHNNDLIEKEACPHSGIGTICLHVYYYTSTINIQEKIAGLKSRKTTYSEDMKQLMKPTQKYPRY
jgi:hypothetical protein